MSQTLHAKPHYLSINCKQYHVALKPRACMNIWLDKGMSWFATEQSRFAPRAPCKKSFSKVSCPSLVWDAFVLLSKLSNGALNAHRLQSHLGFKDRAVLAS